MLSSVFRPALLAGAAAGTLCAAPALAQQAPAAAEARQAQTVVVTGARQRAESVQDAPLAVQAFDAATIASAGINRPADFVALTPNVTFIQTTNVGESQVHIRGVIQPRDTEPPFAYVVDGVLIPNPNAFNQELVDIQQIEVIKGPIGSIYGRNAIGGAILVSTKKPGPTTEGVVQAGYEFEGDEYKLGGYVSGALAENVFARLTLSYTDRDGYFDNITRRAKEDPFNELVARGRIVWEISPALELDVSANWGQIEGYAFAFNNQLSFTPGFTTLSPRGVSTADTSLPFVGNLGSFNNQDRWGVSARLTWETGAGTLSAFVARNELEENMGGEGAADLALFGLLGPPGPNVPAPGAFFADPRLFEGYGPTDRDGAQYQERNQTDTSVEVRFTSPEDNALRYIVGAYYIDFERDIKLLTGEVGTGNRVRRAPVIRVGGPNFGGGSGGDNFNSAYAVFGQIAYDLTDKIELSAALRYDKEERDNVNTVPNTGIGAPLGARRSGEFEATQPRISIRYEPNDAVTLYATYGEGFRSGGFNPLGSRALIVNVDGKTNTTVQDAFPKETSQSWEAGVKTTSFGGRLAFNAAVFATDVENAHFFQFFPFSLARVISIVQANEIRGAEFDFTFDVTDSFKVFGGAGVLDSEITQNREEPGTVGNQMPFTPENSFTLGAQYERTIGPFDFTTRIDWNRTGEMWFDAANTPGTARPELDLVNLRASLAGERWTVTAFSRNLFDEAYNVDAVVLNVPPPAGLTFNFVTKGTPRTFGLEFKYNFGG